MVPFMLKSADSILASMNAITLKSITADGTKASDDLDAGRRCCGTSGTLPGTGGAGRLGREGGGLLGSGGGVSRLAVLLP